MGIAKDGYDRVEHDGDVNAKNISIVKSTATIYAVVNTGSTGISNSLVTVLNPVSIAGNVTIDSGTVSVDSNTAWSDPNTYIGLATVDIGSAPTLTVDATGQGDVPITLDGEQVTTTLKGNVTLSDPKGYIGLVSTASINGRVSIAGNVTVNVGSLISLRGNVTVVDGGGSLTVDNSGTFAVQATQAGTWNVGTVTAVTDITNPVAIKGNLTINSGSIGVTSNTAWADPNTYIGLATVDIGSAPTLTVDATGQGDVPVTLDGEAVVLGAGAAYAGLATVDVGKSERYSYAYTSGPTTDWIVKGSAGFVHAIHVGAAVASSVIEMSDHATDGDGNVQIYQSGDTIGPAVYPLNMTMGTGITLDITNQTHVTVIYK